MDVISIAASSPTPVPTAFMKRCTFRASRVPPVGRDDRRRTADESPRIRAGRQGEHDRLRGRRQISIGTTCAVTPRYFEEVSLGEASRYSTDAAKRGGGSA